MLYLLRPVADKLAWLPWYDKAFGFVVDAEDELNARTLASKDAGDEGKQVWLDANQTTCVPLLSQEGRNEMIIKDFNAA